MKREPRIHKEPNSSQPTLEDLEKGLTINEHGLEDECRMHPDLYYRVAKQSALAISRRDAAKQEVEELTARAADRARKVAATHGDKITVAEIETTALLNKDVQAAKQTLLDLNANVGQLQALKDSFQQRSYALSHLVDLYLHQYYSDAATSRTGDVKSANAENARQRLNEMRRSQTRR